MRLAAFDFYKRAFDAVEEGDRVGYEGKIGHGEIRIRGARIMIADEFPGHNNSPAQLRGTTVQLHLEVDNCDVATQQAVEAGAELIRAPGDTPAGRISKLRDPFGHVWMLNQSS